MKCPSSGIIIDILVGLYSFGVIFRPLRCRSRRFDSGQYSQCVFRYRRHGRKQKSVFVHIEQNHRRPAERVLPEFKLRRRERPSGEFQSHGITVRSGHDQLL